MLQNAYLLAKIGADTAENEQHFAEILPKIGNYPTGRLTSWRLLGFRRCIAVQEKSRWESESPEVFLSLTTPKERNFILRDVRRAFKKCTSIKTTSRLACHEKWTKFSSKWASGQILSRCERYPVQLVTVLICFVCTAENGPFKVAQL